jgi:hypothetical protein
MNPGNESVQRRKILHCNLNRIRVFFLQFDLSEMNQENLLFFVPKMSRLTQSVIHSPNISACQDVNACTVGYL